MKLNTFIHYGINCVIYINKYFLLLYYEKTNI